MAKLPSLVKAYLGEKIVAESTQSAQPAPTNPAENNTVGPSNVGAKGAEGNVARSSRINVDGTTDVAPVSSGAEFAGIGEGVQRTSSATSDGSKLSGVQATGSILVGAAGVGLAQSGALGDSDDTKETIKAVGQKILEDSGVSSRTANNVLEAAMGNKNAQVELGVQAVSGLTGGFISEQTGVTIANALDGDKASQRQLILKTVNALSNDSPAAPVIKAVGKLGQSVLDSILPRGNPLRAMASDFIGKEGSKLLNKAPSNDPGPVISTPISMSRLQKIRQRNDPLFNFDWKVELPSIGDASINVGADLLNFYVEEVSINLPNFQTEDVFRCGTRKMYPSFSDVGTISLTFYEDNEMSASAYLTHWHSLVQNKAQLYYNLPSVYKKTFYVYCYDVKGNTVGLFKVTDAWPTSRGSYSLQSSSSDRVIISVELATDGIFFQRVQGGTPISISQPVAAGKQKTDYSGPMSSMLQAVGIPSLFAAPISKVAGSFIK